MSCRLLMLPGAYTSPAARFRMWELVEPLSRLGFEVTVRVPSPDRVGRNPNGELAAAARLGARLAQLCRLSTAAWAVRDAHRFDVVYANRDIVPEPSVRFPEQWIFRRGGRLVFDFDDAVHLGRRRRKIEWILRHSTHSTPGNESLAAFAREWASGVTVVPTVVNTETYRPAEQRLPGPVRVGWSGSDSTNEHCLPILEDPIRALSREVEIEFVVISNVDPEIRWNGVSTRFIKWNAATEVRDLQLVDIGCMPLRDNEFERGKCALKAIQYMAVGAPAVVSPVGVNSTVVSHGADGFHASSHDDWVRSLRILVQNAHLRADLAEAARKKVVSEYSHTTAVPLLAGVFAEVTAH